MRRDDGYIGQSRCWMLEVELPSRSRRGRPERFVDVMKEHMKIVGVKAEEAEERERWRQRIQCGKPHREQEGENNNEEIKKHLSVKS